MTSSMACWDTDAPAGRPLRTATMDSKTVRAASALPDSTRPASSWSMALMLS